MSSPVPNPYFLYPWAIDSNGGTDTIVIPNTGADSGAVNYENGWTPNYEYASTDPASLPVPRPQMNQLFLDITYALQQLQKQGYPLWIATASGGPTSYPIYSTVAYNAGSGIKIWESQIGSNTSTPGADNNWVNISGNAQGVQPGTFIDFGGPVPPTGYLFCDGSQILRASYANLLSALTVTQTCTTNGTVTLTVPSTAYLFPGMPIEGTNIATSPGVTTIVSITNSTTLVMSQAATGSGSNATTFFVYANGNGTTTFTLPILLGSMCYGAGSAPNTATGGIGTLGLATVRTGQIGGRSNLALTETELPNHTHTMTHGTSLVNDPTVSPAGHLTAGSSTVGASNINAIGGGAVFNIIPQVIATTKCIKF